MRKVIIGGLQISKMRTEYEIRWSINDLDGKRKKSKECNLMYEALSALKDAFHCNRQKRRNIDLSYIYSAK